MQKHEKYEELCALAAIGQLTDVEQRELNEHIDSCRDCQAACRDFSSVLRELPVTEETKYLIELRKAEENVYRERFLARAQKEGREFSREAEEGRVRGGSFWRVPHIAMFQKSFSTVLPVALALVLVCGILVLKNHVRSAIPWPPAALSSAESVGRLESNSMKAQLMALEKAGSILDNDMKLLKVENATLRSGLQARDHDLQTTQTEKEQLAMALASANALNNQLDSQIRDNDAILAQSHDELEKLRSDRLETIASLAMERRTVDELSTRLKVQTDGLDNEKELLSEGRDIRDLMGARNLHIIDVFDSDAKGKNRKSFGRVFYTEGKSLIFYAFDLDRGKAVDAKYAFEAWGERLGEPSTVKNLGVFFADDNTQKRWVLKLDNPAQIAQINSVFVTLEQNGESTSPHGKKILYAFLGGNANHP